MKKRTFHPGGVRLHDFKLSAGQPIERVELPMKVTLTLDRYLGRPATAIVKPGDAVSRFQLVAEASAHVSSNIHSPISGTVKSVDIANDAFGFPSSTIVIEATEEQHRADMAMTLSRLRDDRTIDSLRPEEIRRICRDCGLVGMGGATFPTDVKLTVPEGKKADVLIINGSECEPFLTCDHALMLEQPEEIIRGVELARKACGAPKAVIGVEENKQDAAERLSESVPAEMPIEVACLKERYPQGGEKQLINALTGRYVPSGKLPIDAGAVVVNVATAHALWLAVAYGRPLVERVVTVTGPDVPKPANYLTCIGHDVAELLAMSGVEAIEQGSKLISGGPMMGRTAATIHAATAKGTSGILLLPPGMALREEVEPCVRCARCVEACPMGLEPYLIATLSRRGLFERARAESVTDCIECGCCSYICPSKRPLLDFIRLGKDTLHRLNTK